MKQSWKNQIFEFGKHHSIAFKQCMVIVLSGALLLGVVYHTVLYASQSILTEALRQAMLYAVRESADSVSHQLNVAGQQAEDLSIILETTALDTTRIFDVLQQQLEFLHRNIPAVVGGAVCFSPDYSEDRDPYRMLYVSFEDGVAKTRIFGGNEYPYWEKDWFVTPREQDQAVWSEPYQDNFASSELLTSYSVPFYRVIHDERRFVGVVTVNLSIAEIRKNFQSITFTNHGYSVLTSRTGTFLSHPDAGKIGKENFLKLAEPLEDGNFLLRETAEKMMNGAEGMVRFPKTGVMEEPVLFYYTPIPSAQWSLAMVFPEQEVLERLYDLRLLLLFACLMGLGLLVFVSWFLLRLVGKPLSALSRAAEAIGSGRFDTALPEYQAKDEIGRLTDSFGKMQRELRNRMTDLEHNIIARQELESELSVARNIQSGILPNLKHVLKPQEKRFEFFAKLTAARTVSGDLYDVFYLDKDHLCVILGDVSGKGVPAALFMAVTQTLQRSEVEKFSDTGEVVTRMNALLSRNNPQVMYVTYFIAFINLQTGEMTYTNAGHNRPYVLRADGSILKLDEAHGLPLGMMRKGQYDSNSLTFHAGDGIFIYSDGVTEARDVKHREFGEERLEKALLEHDETWSPRQMLKQVTLKVSHFIGYHEQTDDITMLAFRYNATDKK